MLPHLPAPASLGCRGRNVWVAETIGVVYRAKTKERGGASLLLSLLV